MGNFYTNYTVRSASPQAVAAAMAGRAAIISPVSKGCVVIYDAESDKQDQEVITKLAKKLSTDLNAAVLAVLNHDDDILWYALCSAGKIEDEYNSCPDYFGSDGDAEPRGPTGGDAAKLCHAFARPESKRLEEILRKDPLDGYAFAVERHADLADALGLPAFAVGIGYTYLDQGEFPEGLSENDIIRTA